jgi:hypothetical protein
VPYLAMLMLGLLGAAALSGFAAMVCFLRAGILPDRHHPSGRPRAARLELILGLDLDEDAHRHWQRAWTCTALFLLSWFLAFLVAALILPQLRPG